MVENELETHYMKHLSKISKAMIDDNSSFATQIKKIEEQFTRFGLTNDQFAQIISQINASATQYITQYANSSSLELVKVEQNQPLIDAQVEIAKADLALKQKDLELKEKDLELRDKEIELKNKELTLKDKQIEMMDKELAIKEQELLLRKEELKKMYAEIDLIQAKVQTELKQLEIMEQDLLIKKQQVLESIQKVLLIKKQIDDLTQDILNKQQQVRESQEKVKLITQQITTEKKQQDMIVAQTGLVSRQTLGYNDNLRVKAAEFRGGLASFAVNSGSDFAQSAIDNFNSSIGAL